MIDSSRPFSVTSCEATLCNAALVLYHAEQGVWQDPDLTILGFFEKPAAPKGAAGCFLRKEGD